MDDEKFNDEHREQEPEQDSAATPSEHPDSLEEDPGFREQDVHPEELAETPAEDLSDGVHSGAHDHEVDLPPAAAEATAQDGAGAAESARPEKNWYIIHAYSGFEQKVAESLRTRAQAFGFADRLGQILIPTEEVIELKNGKKVTSKRLLYPGYVLVEMEMDDELWHAVKSTPRVTGFVGGGTKPVPLTADEVNSVLYRQASSADHPRPKMTFEKNETVKIIDGPFTNFSGKVDEVNSERNTLRVLVTIFGRSTPVELDFLQVEKI
ncbi:MAG: transcription termination/antitermination protein NusG [Acidobacteriia bacterium]|nr:transcription termination/antitermination protein NusG [Terriglobia bacterium]